MKGDCSTFYSSILMEADASRQMFGNNPSAKLIFIARDPVERIESSTESAVPLMKNSSIQRKGNRSQVYWFRAKRRGWGWDLPLTWQGWLVAVVCIGSIFLAYFIFPPEKNPSIFVIFTIFVSLSTVVICWIKGEPARWRWGKGKNTK